MIIMSLDYSFRKSGICIMKVEDDKLTILYSDLIVSDETLDVIPRILNGIEQINIIYNANKPDIIIRESPFIGRASTAKPILYAHALLELHLYKNNIELIDVHNATLKAFCRKYLVDRSFYTKDELKQFNAKQIVAEFLKCYFSSDMPEIYTKRGRLKDDECDAIALAVYHYEKNLK